MEGLPKFRVHRLQIWSYRICIEKHYSTLFSVSTRTTQCMCFVPHPASNGPRVIRRTTDSIINRTIKCIEAEGAQFEILLWTELEMVW